MLKLFLLFFTSASISLSSAQSLTESKYLSILTYNIKGLPSFASQGYDQDRYADIGKILADRARTGNAPEIVLLQESFVERTKELRDIAGYPYVAKGPNTATLLGVDSGLYILSKYPIIHSETREFGSELCASWDCYSNKGVQMARIAVPGLPVPIDVYNTHMQASRENEDVRRRQVDILAEFLAKTHLKENPILFGGDFNFRPEGARIAYDYFSRKTSLKNAAEFCETDKCYDGKRRWGSSVDHHFFGALGRLQSIRPLAVFGSFLEKVKGRFLSDHFGLETKYEFTWIPTVKNRFLRQ